MSEKVKCPNCKEQIYTADTSFKLQRDNADLRANLAAATDGVRDWKNAHALLKEQFHKQRVLLEAATKRLEEAEKQEPFGVLEEFIGDGLFSFRAYVGANVGETLYTSPIPPADVAELQKQLAKKNRVIQCRNDDLREQQEHIAELERKLAEQQAILLNISNGLQEIQEAEYGEDADEAARSMQRLIGTIAGTELNKLLSEAREKAVPDDVRKFIDVWANEQTSGMNPHDRGAIWACREIRAMLAAAPSPALNAKEGGE